jgi:plastocyanin
VGDRILSCPSCPSRTIAARIGLAGLAVLSGLAVLGGLAGAAAAEPGRITGTVKVSEPDGVPASAADVIVYVVGFTEPASDQVTTVAQKGRKFAPDLVAITVGEKVAFPNYDAFLHNVFSLSGTRKFDLGSFTRGESKARQFPEAGVVDVYCNIHPEMAATILVLPNRRHVNAAPDGTFTLDGVPPGDWTVFAYTRRATKPASAKVSVRSGSATTVDLAIARGGEPAHLNKYGEKYHDAAPVYR